MRTCFLAVVALLASVPGSAQDAPAPSGPVAGASMDKLVGWYDVRLKVPPTRCLTQQIGGEYRAVMEITVGRRGVVLHLEQLKSIFEQPIVLHVGSNERIVFSGSTPVRMGPIAAPVPTRIIGEAADDGESFQANVTSGNSLCRLEGELSGKRTTAPPPPTTPGASVLTDGYITSPAQTDQPFGASINSDGSVPPPPATVPPSPLIKGTYSTRLTVRESKCVQQDLRGSWQRNLDLTPRPGILIPLNQFNSAFSAPVVLTVQGLAISQSTEIQVNFGFGTHVPATFEGVFTSDASQFNVRFEARNSLCHVSGTIDGTRL